MVAAQKEKTAAQEEIPVDWAHMDGLSGWWRWGRPLSVMWSKVSTYTFWYLHSNTSLFQESFALGLSLTVSGDTPISAIATLVLFFICALNDDMASSLNDLRSSIAFSYNDNLRVHLWHTYGETPSSSSTVMSNIAEILEDHSFLMPALLKRLIVFSTFVHSLHTFTEAIASKFSKHASIYIYIFF